MRTWLLTWTLGAAACGFTPAGAGDPDARRDDPDALAGDPDAAASDAAASDAGPGPDARPLDAPTAVDAATCPPEYTIAVGASRYRLHGDPDVTSVALAGDDCDDDQVGSTHLATLENADLDAVLTAAGANPSREIYVGAECNTTGADCDLQPNWTWLGSSVPVAATLWHTDEPLGGFEFAYADRRGSTWGLVSSAGFTARQYLCECGR